jgi:hypothetical protein
LLEQITYPDYHVSFITPQAWEKVKETAIISLGRELIDPNQQHGPDERPDDDHFMLDRLYIQTFFTKREWFFVRSAINTRARFGLFLIALAIEDGPGKDESTKCSSDQWRVYIQEAVKPIYDSSSEAAQDVILNIIDYLLVDAGLSFNPRNLEEEVEKAEVVEILDYKASILIELLHQGGVGFQFINEPAGTMSVVWVESQKELEKFIYLVDEGMGEMYR